VHNEDDTDPGAVTILLAEDDPFLRDLLGSTLRRHGYLVLEAESGDRAVSLLHQNRIDVLVTDIVMPGELDGWALGEQARRVHPGVAVVYSSSRPAEAERQVSRSLYIRKPYHPDAVVGAIRQLTSRRKDSGPAEG
jgi:DNA-binding response OmpR family regulator